MDIPKPSKPHLNICADYVAIIAVTHFAERLKNHPRFETDSMAVLTNTLAEYCDEMRANKETAEEVDIKEPLIKSILKNGKQKRGKAR